MRLPSIQPQPAGAPARQLASFQQKNYHSGPACSPPTHPHRKPCVPSTPPRIQPVRTEGTGPPSPHPGTAVNRLQHLPSLMPRSLAPRCCTAHSPRARRVRGVGSAVAAATRVLLRVRGVAPPRAPPAPSESNPTSPPAAAAAARRRLRVAAAGVPSRAASAAAAALGDASGDSSPAPARLERRRRCDTGVEGAPEGAAAGGGQGGDGWGQRRGSRQREVPSALSCVSALTPSAIASTPSCAGKTAGAWQLGRAGASNRCRGTHLQAGPC